MKKVMITLGFAAATILAANAQETTPQPETQPATQTQPTPSQDETLDPQTQPMQDDQAMDTQTEPMRDQDMDTQPGNLGDQPATTTYPTDPTQGDVNETPMEPMDENVGGVDEPLEDQPDYSTQQDPQSTEIDATTTEDQPRYPTETEPMDEAKETATQPIDETQQEVREMQGEPANPNRDSQEQAQKEIGEEGGVMSITQADLPEEVTSSLQDSDYSQATIEEAYMLEDIAIDKLMEADAEQMYIGDQLPDKLYQLRVRGEDDQRTLLYFDENGEMMGEKSI